MKAVILKKLGEVLDPELNISIVDLGLIYDVQEQTGEVKIKMTLTTMGCPLFDVIDQEIKKAVAEIKGINKVEVELVFDPPWSKERLSPAARAQLGV